MKSGHRVRGAGPEVVDWSRSRSRMTLESGMPDWLSRACGGGGLLIRTSADSRVAPIRLVIRMTCMRASRALTSCHVSDDGNIRMNQAESLYIIYLINIFVTSDL